MSFGIDARGILARGLSLSLSFIVSPLHAEVVESVGYGTGDDLDQAKIAALGDALLNARSKAVVKAEVQEGGAGGESRDFSSEMHVVDCDFIEQGESFDGTYARVRMKLSKDAHPGRKDGVTEITGEGLGGTEEEAVLAALGDILTLAGGRLSASVKSWGEKVVKDELSANGSGFVKSFKVLSAAKEGEGKWRACVGAAVSPYAEGADLAGQPVGGEASGEDIGAAIARARRDAVLSIGAGYKYDAIFESGTNRVKRLERTTDGVFSGLDAAIGERGGMKAISVSGVTGAAVEANGARMSAVAGHGFADDYQTALALARCDALFAYECHARVCLETDFNSLSGETMLVKAGHFIVVKGAERRADGVAVDAAVGESAQDVLGGGAFKSRGTADSASLQDSFALAKFYAAMNAGMALDATMRCENGDIVGCEAEGAFSGTVDSFKFDYGGGGTGGLADGMVVATAIAGNGTTFRAGQSDPVAGYGFDGDPSSAFALARIDAALNSHVAVEKKSRLKIDFTQDAPASACALRGVAQDSLTLSNNAFVAVGKAKAIGENGLALSALVGAGSPDVWTGPTTAVQGEGVGRNEQEAVDAARFDAVYKAGIQIDAKAEYANGVLRELVADGRCDTDIRGLNIISIDKSSGQCRAKVGIAVAPGGRGPLLETARTDGIGVGGTFEEARSAARLNAVLNAASRMVQKYRWRNGSLYRNETSLEGDGVFYDDGFAKIGYDNGTYVVRSSTTIGHKTKTFPKRPGEVTVRVCGYGRTAREAKRDARRNAIDKAFGRTITAKAENGDLTDFVFSESAIKDGYVRCMEVVGKSVALETPSRKWWRRSDKLWRVEADAVVGKGFMRWSWKTTLVLLVLVVIAVVVAMAGNPVVIVAAIAGCILVFWLGHWVVGILMVVAGLCAALAAA